MSMAFRERLIYLRKEYGLTQQELADRLGLAQSAIGMYETGKREPDHDTTAKIAKYFGVTTDYMLGISEKQITQEERDRSFATLKEIRDKIALGLVSDIPDERIDRIVEYLDFQIKAQEEERAKNDDLPKDENKK